MTKQFIIVLGSAGCGKTTLVANFGKWIEETQDLNVSYVNFDPGVEELPYEPDFDIRNYIKVSDVMRKYHLGPNGALIKSSDLMLNYMDEIHKKLDKISADFILIDTPGQMELFVFRESGPKTISLLKNIGFPVAVIKPKDAYQELVEDLLAIVTSFAGKLYGMRSHKKKRLVQGFKKLLGEVEKNG